MNQLALKALCLLAIISLSYSQQCDVAEALRVDCGYMGINEALCVAKGCCWKPTRLAMFKKDVPNDTPWCFFPSGQNPCQKMVYDWTGGPGFDSSFYQKMYGFFDANIDIQGKGGIVASPDPSTPGGSYYYHWMRDAALTMRTYLEINNFQLSLVEKKMKSYVNWVTKVQKEKDPQGFDVRINPKFELPNGEVYVGGWCRPQTDGPGLRSATLMMFADTLLKAGQTSYVQDTLLNPIKYDLEWIMSNWMSDGCDLWQQVRSNDFFWNRMAYVFAFTRCQELFTKVGDSSTSSKCSTAKNAVKATLDAHWTGSFMKESSNREKDGSVIHSFSSFTGLYSITDEKVAKTIQVYAMTFCGEYAINQQDNKAGLPGVLIGRYPGDSYAGGNPWQLLTAVLAKTFYQGANVLMESNGFLKEADQHAWANLLNIPKNATHKHFIKAALNAGDSVMYRMYQHVKNDGGHIAEQIGRNSGSQTSAKDLTWSYANILSAMKEREKVAAMMKEKFADE